MADPIVTITNGIPVSSVPATGTITTLGQTLVDGANATLGATTDPAATGVGTVNAHLRSIATNISGGLTVSGTITANQGGAPWSMKPDGTVWTLTSTSANVNVTNGSIAVTGTFWQATQPISAASLPLPSGAATSAKQPALGTAGIPSADVITVQGVTSMTPLKVDGTATTQPVSGTITVQQATAANLNATVTGTVAATQGGTWTGRMVGNTGATLDTAASQNAAMPTNMLMVGAEFNTTPTTITSGNASPLQMDSAGNLLVNIKAGAAAGGTASSFGAAFPATGTAIGAKDNAGTNMTFLQVNASNALKVDGSAVTQPVSGTFWQATQPVSIAATVNVSAVQSGTWTVQQGTPPWSMGGDVASGSADSGNPVKNGGVARTSNPTAVTNGQRVNASFDKLGKQICVGAIRDVKGVQKTSITVATETTVVTAGSAGVFNDVYAIVVTNKSATGVYVDFKDATAGTTRMTLAAPAGDTRGFTVAVDSAMVQATAANNWTATVSSAVTSIEITMLYVSNL